MSKIQMTTPLVELDGDEMTRVIWQMIKDKLITPYVDLKTEYYDLSVKNCDNTDDKVTYDSAYAIKKYHVGVKCATITANPQRVEEFHLKQMLPSPNGTVRGILDGTIFRAPIIVRGMKANVRSWVKPITVARHGFGDIFNGQDFQVKEEGKAELIYTNAAGEETYRKTLEEFKDGGVVQAVYNRDQSIREFADSCFQYCIDTKQDLWFSTKDTINKQYDGRFREIFQQEYDNKYKEEFEKLGVTYFYTLIDDAVARTIRNEGGYVWALKNYDGDVMSDMVSSGFGSLAMMTSVCISAEGNYEYEAAHGTVPRHYHKYLAGEKTSTNPVATIFAWTGALKKRGELDQNKELTAFAEKVEQACIATIEAGEVTKDLVPLMDEVHTVALNTEEFMDAVNSRLKMLLV